MAEREGTNLFTRLADAGEDAIQRMAEMPGAGRIMNTLTGMRERIDELQKRMSGLDALERRVGELERRIDELSTPRVRTRARRPPRAATDTAATKTAATRTRRAVETRGEEKT